jgi:glycoprotein-N-acetylgalactosamine 3-beta-galactosyltransferase
VSSSTTRQLFIFHYSKTNISIISICFCTPQTETSQKCDGFMVASTKTDKKLGTVFIPHEGPEEYNNIWQKVRSMWSYIYDNYYEKVRGLSACTVAAIKYNILHLNHSIGINAPQYDYFHIGGDDLYLIVENLRLYLESEEIQLASNGGRYLPDGTEDAQTPLFLGRRFAEGGNRDRMFISGGSGYTLNKAALKTLVVDCFPECFPHMHTFSEDVMVATCLRKVRVGIYREYFSRHTPY